MKRFLFQPTCIFACLLMIASCVQGPDRDTDKTIFVNYASLDMLVGDEIQITASPTEETFTWESANTTVATVSSQGEVHALSDGVTEIYVGYGDVRRTIPVNVSAVIQVTGISVSMSSLELNPGETTIIRASILPANYNERGTFTILWQSSDPSIVTVTEGEVEAIKGGSAVITVTLKERPSVKTEIPVTVVIPPTIDISKFSDAGYNLLYSKVTFEKDGEITIVGIDKALFGTVYNRDFFSYNPVEGTLKFLGESGVWDVYYSSKYNYFWICRMNDVAPACYWILGHGFWSVPRWHSDMSGTGWSDAEIRQLGYVRPLGDGKYQASIYLTDQHSWGGFDIQVYSNRAWTGVISNPAITSNPPGIVLHSNGSDIVNGADGYVAGYYRMTLDVPNNTLDFEKID